MALSRSYHVWPPGMSGFVGVDLSFLVPLGFRFSTVSLEIATNTNPANATSDFTQQPVSTGQRQAWCLISGGVPGTDYQLRWTVTDNHGHSWSSTAVMLCAYSA